MVIMSFDDGTTQVLPMKYFREIEQFFIESTKDPKGSLYD